MTEMAGNATLRGRCTCGSVRYQMDAPPLFVHACHCTWCQRETGGAFAVNALVETDRLRVEGEPELLDTPSASGRGQKIARCPHCRVALWSHYPGLGEPVSFVRVGTLEEPGRVRPDVHIFVSTKVPWLELPGDVPVMSGYYDMKALWPAESWQRLTAVRSA